MSSTIGAAVRVPGCPVMRAIVLTALLPAVALASPPPGHNRTGVLLIPMDQGAEAQALKMETWMVEALEEFSSVAVKRTDELFGLPPDEEAEASLKRAEKGYEESDRAFTAGDLEDAERKLRATLKEYRKAAAAMSSCGHLCDALAMYAATLHRRGDSEEAKLALIDLLALEPSYDVNVKKLGRELLTLKTQVATSRSAAFRGNANVKTRPAGARVYVDGDFKGFSPVTVSTLPVGKHLLRIERPGFKRYGAIIEVTPDDVDVSTELLPTPAWKAWDGQMDQVAADASRGSGPSLSAVGKNLALDRALIGTVKELDQSGATEVNVGVFELHSGKRLAAKKVIYQGDEFGQLRHEVERLVNQLFNSIGKAKETASRSSDPLENTSGTEDWSSDDRGGRNENKRSNGDPLDGISGMEDW